MKLHLAPTSRAELRQPLELPFVEFVPGIKESVLCRPPVEVPMTIRDGRVALQPILHPPPRNVPRWPADLRLEVIDHAKKQVRRPIHPGSPAESTRRSPQRDLNIK